MDITEAEILRRGGKRIQKSYTKKTFMTQITTMVVMPRARHALECKVKWALGSITMNKATEGDGNFS